MTTTDPRWIDFSKIPFETLVDVRHHGNHQYITLSRAIATSPFSRVCSGGSNADESIYLAHEFRISAKNPWIPWHGGELSHRFPNCTIAMRDVFGREYIAMSWEIECDIRGLMVNDNFSGGIMYKLCMTQWQTIDGVCAQIHENY